MFKKLLLLGAVVLASNPVFADNCTAKLDKYMSRLETIRADHPLLKHEVDKIKDLRKSVPDCKVMADVTPIRDILKEISKKES